MSHQTPHFNTLTDFLRFYTSDVTQWLGQKFGRLGIHPDLITLTGVVIVAIASYVIAQGHFFWGAVILLMGTSLDALDGAVARAVGRKDRFGALFDSTLDRYSDAFIFTGLAYYFSDWSDNTGVVLCIFALIGTQLVSYVRARAEGLKVECKVGLMTRLERIIIIVVMLVLGWLKLGLWILVIGTHFTVFQRVWHVYRQLAQGDTTS